MSDINDGKWSRNEVMAKRSFFRFFSSFGRLCYVLLLIFYYSWWTSAVKLQDKNVRSKSYYITSAKLMCINIGYKKHFRARISNQKQCVPFSSAVNGGTKVCVLSFWNVMRRRNTNILTYNELIWIHLFRSWLPYDQDPVHQMYFGDRILHANKLPPHIFVDKDECPISK